MPVEQQVVSIYAGTGGYLDDIPVADVKRFEVELLDWFATRHRDVLDGIRDSGQLPEGDKLAEITQAFKDQFRPTEVVAESTE
jgi:F-type H+-transporting ATPase subunit alpha